MNQNCKYCGTPLAGYETFCPGCGRELSTDGGAGFRPDTAEDTYEPKTTAAVQNMSDDEWFPADFAEAEQKRAPKSPVPQQKTSARRAVPQKGAPRRPASKASANQQTITGKPRMILLGALAVAAILLIALGIGLLRGGDDRVRYPFTPVVDNYFAAVRTANAEKFIATRPAAYTAYLTAGSGSAYSSESHYRSETAATLHSRLNDYKAQYGDIKSISYELTSVKQYNHRCEALSEVLTGWYDFPENAVQDAYIVSGKYTVHGSNGSGEYDITELLLIQVGDEWYFSPDAGSYWKGE